MQFMVNMAENKEALIPKHNPEEPSVYKATLIPKYNFNCAECVQGSPNSKI